MKRQAISEKILVLGIDGMDPALTKKYMDEGKLPNVKKFVEKGVCREDLVMFGVVPTITPPSWTTLSTGANPETHGITDFCRQDLDNLDTVFTNLDSRYCKAEQLWNVFADEGKKTLVWHWPGSSWPPTSDNPNLHVVEGTNPISINSGVASRDWEKLIYASEDIQSVLYKPKVAHSTGAGCLITDIEVEENDHVDMGHAVIEKGIVNIILKLGEDSDACCESLGFDLVNTPIKDASGWANAPEGVKEFFIVHSNGLARRPVLILKNEKGIYDKIAIYHSKKDAEPYLTLERTGEFSPIVLEDVKVEEKTVACTRTYKVLEIAPDGSMIRLWMSEGMDVNCDTFWMPNALYKRVIDNVGYVPSVNNTHGTDPIMVTELKQPSWYRYTKWQADALNYCIEKEEYKVIFSHLHNVDTEGHGYWQLCKNRKRNQADETVFQQFMENCYVDTDRYIGRFLHLLDEGWSIFIVSDHGLVTREEEETVMLADAGGVMVPVMEELGYTTVKRDADGKRIKEIDWEKTTALNVRGPYIWINLKGRNKTGIVDPGDKYALETKIIDDLYKYRDPQTGKRVVSLAIRNKEAAILGLSGPDTGDIIFFVEEEFIAVHGDGLPTYQGYTNTSLAPIFMAAGTGFKKGVYVDRVIREVDVAPTMAILGGVRMPAQCEGAPLYQMLEEEV